MHYEWQKCIEIFKLRQMGEKIMICAECLRCANYMVSEVGCYGSSSPCNSEIEVEYEDEEGEQNDR